MNTKAEKLYNIQLSESEIYAIIEGLAEPVAQAAMTGNNITEFIEMIKSHAKARPAKEEESRSIVENYTTMNRLLLFHRNDLLNVIVKAEAAAKTI
ncbi:MAG: hypothetical protein Q7U54_16185 [Bacteroidales bacterium]|nr:hypothetical protein [Bacteroidales bacterium]